MVVSAVTVEASQRTRLTVEKVNKNKKKMIIAYMYVSACSVPNPGSIVVWYLGSLGDHCLVFVVYRVLLLIDKVHVPYKNE